MHPRNGQPCRPGSRGLPRRVDVVELLRRGGSKWPGVGQSKGHPDKLVLPEWRREHRFFLVGASDRDRMEGPIPIKGGEDVAPRKVGQIVGDVGKREGILLRDSIELPVVDGPTNFPAVLLWNRDEGEGPQQIGFHHNSLFQPSVDLLPQGLLHDGVQWSMLHFYRGGP